MAPQRKRTQKESPAAHAEPSIRTCGNCAHFRIHDEGYEIGRIEDTKYMESGCDVLGWRVKEHYLFTSELQPAPEIRRQKDCPHWTYFKDAPGRD